MFFKFYQGKERGENEEATYVFFSFFFFLQLSGYTHRSGEMPVWCLAGFRKLPNEKINRNGISRCSTVGDHHCLLSMEAKGKAVVRVTLYEHTHISYPLISYSWNKIKTAQQIQTDGDLVFSKKKKKQKELRKSTKFGKVRNIPCVLSE